MIRRGQICTGRIIPKMKSTVEINKFIFRVDQKALEDLNSEIFYQEDRLPVLNIPYKLGLVTLEWNDSQGDMPVKLMAVGELVDPKWSVIARIQFLISCHWTKEIVKWGDFRNFFIEEISLGEDSVLFIDDHNWDLIPTLNKILVERKDVIPGLISQHLNSILSKASLKYFNSNLILDILDDLYFRISRSINGSLETLELTASGDQDLGGENENPATYASIQIPTSDFTYFMNHFVHPNIEVRGYELMFISLEAIGDNTLIINLKEAINNWNIRMEVSFILRDNSLHPNVRQLQVQGLDILKRTMFQLFKGILIRQIENRPLPLDRLYRNLKKKAEERFPFIRLMPGKELRFDKLKMTLEMVEVVVSSEG